MATNTKLLQAMADTMLPLFGDMPRVLLEVRDDPAFHVERPPCAVYAAPNILINPHNPPTISFNFMKELVCHELIHAWVDWKGLNSAGEFLDEAHNEWFVKKALEINRLNLDGLNVSVEYLLTTPESIRIYNRLAGITRLPRQSDEVLKPLLHDNRPVPEIVFKKREYSWKVLLGFCLLLTAVLFFNNPRAGYIWIACFLLAVGWLGFEAFKEIKSRRL